MTATTTHYASQMADAIQSIINTAGTKGSNQRVEFLAGQLVGIYFPRIGWGDLSTLERTILRFTWEFVHRTPCPLPLNLPL